MDVCDQKIFESFELLSKESRELFIRTSAAEEDANRLTPLSFYREYVSSNQPVLIRNACLQWPARDKWSRKYFCDVMGDRDVTVAVTPNGYADAIAVRKEDDGTVQEYFVLPEERTMKMTEFFSALDNPDKYPGVYYIQRQNSNLTEDFPELVPDVGAHMPFATEAFGRPPDAVNLWIGDHRAVTSMHKDPYENIYCVVQGYKDFILLPPTDRPWIPYKKFPVAEYREVSAGNFEIIPKTKDSLEQVKPTAEDPESFHEEDNCRNIPWICVDPLKPDLEKFPLYKNTTPLFVRVNAGDALYLPSLWFHHVRQSHACTAVNYWYDMQYDVKYAYYQFLESLAKKTVDCDYG